MKTCRLIVAIRLALFSLIFNLSIAQEVEVDAENISSGTSMEGNEGSYVGDDNQDPQDFSVNAQNDKQISSIPLYQEGQNSQEKEEDSSLIKERNVYHVGMGEAEGIFNDSEEIKILSPQPAEQALDSLNGSGQTSFQKRAQEQDTQDSSSQVDATSGVPQNDNLDIENLLKLGGQPELDEPQTIEIPSLKITEVFWLGKKEWMEITNFSDEEFLGTLSVLGANSNGNTLYSDVKIQGYESVILSSSENIGMSDGEIYSFYPKTISITDGNAIYIELQYSGNIIDSFEVEGTIVNQNKNKTPRPSFQKIYDDGREVQVTTTGDIYNITGFVANPGKVIIKSGNPRIGDGPTISDDPGTGDQTGTGNDSLTGDITRGSPDFNLILSEVFYDDEDERIEIFNIGSGVFFGDLILSGLIFSGNQTSYTFQNVQIPAHDFLIIADSDEMFHFSGDVNIVLNENSFPQFSISDTDEIQISLLLSGEMIDSFYAHEYRVNKRDDYGVSFHKILTENGPIVTRSFSNDDVNLSEDTYNSANPGVLYTFADNIVDYSKSPEDSIGEENSDMVDCSNVHGDIITISEVFRGGSRYNPYIEFSIHEDIMYDYDSLLLSGSLLTQSLTIDLDRETETYDRQKLQKNTKLILTTEAGDLTEAGLITIVLHPDLSFNSFSGELGLYGIDGQSRQLLDIVKITTGSSEKSTYTNGSNHRCGITMDNVMDFSPGFDESALKYFSVTSQYNEKIIETVKYVGGGGGCSCPSKAELCGTTTGNVVETGDVVLTGDMQDSSEQAPQNDENVQDSSLYSEGQAIKIVSLEPKNPESITLQSFLSYDIDFKNHNYYLKTSTATTKKYIDGILYSNTVDTFSKTFGFVDAGACVYLYSGDIQLDSYCYSTEKQQTEKEKQEVETLNPSDYQLSIIHIDYDPEGSDSGNESITIKSNSSKSLDLSKIKMKVNATNKKLNGILEPNDSITLKGSFGFPNSTKDGSDVVVILFYDNYIFSTYTYNPNKLKVEIPDGAVKVYSVIDGDTFRYRNEDGILQSVRLLGVDAPESNTARYRTTECFGKEAKNYLTNLIKNQYVTLETDKIAASSDAYGRMLAYVYLDGKLVNETLIAEGYAKEYTYKTSYTHQSAFKQAEENAKRTEKGLWSSSTCGKSIEEEPEAWGIDYEKLSIKISNVVYDPDGTDSGNEIVQLNVDNSQISSVSSIDFSDDFSFTIFPRSEYATGTMKNKKLSEFGIFDLSTSSEITLKGNFGLPNNRATCVSLNQGSYTFDTRCYNPNQPLSEEEIVLSGDILTFIPNVKIQSIIPNPSGKDSGKEEITLLRTPSDDFPESPDLLNLSPDFSLLINDKTKKKLVGNLIPNQKITIKGSFGFPNSASCVSLLYKGEELDKFCYSKASDGVKFNSDNTSVHEIPAEELAIVKKITLVKNGDKLCISYNKTQFSCKSIPNSTTEKNKKQLSMQNTFISELEKYIKSNYSMIYYNSEIKDYFELYSDAKKSIKLGKESVIWGEKNISITDIPSLFVAKYQQNVQDYLITKFQELLPGNVTLALHQLEEKYKQKLTEESDLKFLSYVE